MILQKKSQIHILTYNTSQEHVIKGVIATNNHHGFVPVITFGLS